MTAQLNPILLQLLRNQTSLETLFRPQEPHQSFNLELTQKNLSQQLNILLHNQLIQTILEEKLKNQILMKAFLINSLQIEPKSAPILNRGEGEVIQKKDDDAKENIIKLENIEVEEPSHQHLQAKSERISTELLDSKKGKTIKRVKNQTKNIPKNYGKAIISFIQKNDKLVKRVLSSCGQFQYSQFMTSIRQKKKKLNSIAELRALWIDQEYFFAKPTRILSFIFLKKHSLTYIFNSRVTNYEGHIKYRYRLIEAIHKPRQFTIIKLF